MNPLNSITGTVLAGVALATVIALATTGAPAVNADSLILWLHVLAGIVWVGLLYYFNFVQVPALAEAAADPTGPDGRAISRYVAPRALAWFRWAAVATWLTGFAYLAHNGALGAFALGLLGDTVDTYQLTIGIGVWLGTIMLFNVWVLIWPNQKKVLGLVEAGADEIAVAKRTAFLASRSNVLLSIPMLMSMVGAGHGGFFI
ncbi:MAG: urate hydroxylase PuuD [Gammaproteobacteria bacterium]|nr:urate hydroxylase PuuD [Gammaproteobacteria bacterium]TVQ49417.1 MAG: hypothetical protein EA371_03035 [Gammaproteobacteria bacterium]